MIKKPDSTTALIIEVAGDDAASHRLPGHL
jgi:hypothetical protein